MEQRERSSTSPLPAGAHCSLESQVSSSDQETPSVMHAAVGPRITHFVSGDRPEVSIYLVILRFFFFLLFLSLSTHYQWTHNVQEGRQLPPRSDHKNNLQAMWVIIYCSLLQQARNPHF